MDKAVFFVLIFVLGILCFGFHVFIILLIDILAAAVIYRFKPEWFD